MYSAYGQRTVTAGEGNSPLGYCARDGVLTEQTGLLYMRARYYSPELMRFINEDIIVGDISNSNSLNRYAYVEGNPVTMVDPFGLCATKESLKKTSEEAYIICTKDFIVQAFLEERILKKQGYDVELICLNLTASLYQPKEEKEEGMHLAKEFIRQWNEGIPDDVDLIYIMTHGSERNLLFEEGSYYNALTTNGYNLSRNRVAGSFDDLYEKSVDELHLVACNTGDVGVIGHSCDYSNEDTIVQVHDGTNTAMQISKKITGVVYAWDGSVSFDYFPVFVPRSSKKQGDFNDLISNNHIPEGSPRGQVKYIGGLLLEE